MLQPLALCVLYPEAAHRRFVSSGQGFKEILALQCQLVWMEQQSKSNMGYLCSAIHLKKNIFTCKIFCRNHDYRAEHIPSFDKLEVKIVRNTWGKERGAGMKQKPKLCPLVLQKRNASSNVQLVLFWFVFNQKQTKTKDEFWYFEGRVLEKWPKGRNRNMFILRLCSLKSN